jgi:hypothetical protein
VVFVGILELLGDILGLGREKRLLGWGSFMLCIRSNLLSRMCLGGVG